jgi:hypothetical protein
VILAQLQPPAICALLASSGLPLTELAAPVDQDALFALALLDALLVVKDSDKTLLMLSARPVLLDVENAQTASTAWTALKDSLWITAPRNAMPALDHVLLVDLSELPTALNVSPTPF